MRYALMFFDDGAARDTLNLTDWRALARAHRDFGQRLAEAGAKVIDHEVLEPPAATTTLAFVGGAQTERRAGPHADARFVLGGFYVLDIDSEDTLFDLLRTAPLPHGTGFVEVRPAV